MKSNTYKELKDYYKYIYNTKPKVIFCTAAMIEKVIYYLYIHKYYNMRIIYLENSDVMEEIAEKCFYNIYYTTNINNLQNIGKDHFDATEKSYKESFIFAVITDCFVITNNINIMIHYAELDQYLPSGYVSSPLFFQVEHKNFFVYFKPEYKGKTVAIVFDSSIVKIGYGDLIIILPVLVRYLQENTVDFYYISEKNYKFLSVLLPGCMHYLLEPFRTYDQFIKNKTNMENKYQSIFIYNQFLLFKNNKTSKFHYIEMCSKALGINNIQDVLDNFDPKKSLNYPINVISTIKQKNEYKKIIGVQFYTYSDEKRSWEPELCEKYISMCHDNGIYVISFDECRVYHYAQSKDELTPLEIIGCMKEINLFVGIDSFCGHIASMMGIPNITIWGIHSPFKQYHNEDSFNEISFRCLRNNFSICHTENVLSKIKPETVFSVTLGALNHRIAFDNEFNSYAISKQGKNILYV